VTFSTDLQAFLIAAAIAILIGALAAMAWARRPRR
jgi:hypothetical protein